MHIGKVKIYKQDQGYGVIAPDDGSQDLVFHEIRCIGIEELAEGRRVSYKEEVSPSSGKVEAVDVVVL
jgi:CspA family cold shock protein